MKLQRRKGCPTIRRDLRFTPLSPTLRSMLAAALLLMLLSIACTPTGDPDEPALLVGVAASIQPAAEELALRFESEHGTSVTLVTGASGTLAEQLRQGAPLDVIISADNRYTSALAADGLLDPAGLTVLATGELVAITNLDGPADDAASLLGSSLVRQIALANPDIATVRGSGGALSPGYGSLGGVSRTDRLRRERRARVPVRGERQRGGRFRPPFTAHRLGRSRHPRTGPAAAGSERRSPGHRRSEPWIECGRNSEALHRVDVGRTGHRNVGEVRLRPAG